MVIITEGPDAETAAKLSLAIGSRGAIRTETLRAFTEDEYRKIISELP
ncbi:GYD domain-containing protein [Chloroflexota bacterium]